MDHKRTYLRQRSLLFSLLLALGFLCHPLISGAAPAPILPEIFFMSQSQAEKLPPSVEKAVRNALAQDTGIAADKFTLLSATSTTWPDGCLGLGSPDELCTQALVPGWRVQMGYQGQVWNYRTNNRGNILRRE
jgi:hypothetical protein